MNFFLWVTNLHWRKRNKIEWRAETKVRIVRALYQKSNIIILDEATSALDNKTEEKVINSINEITPDVTLIMIAHRLSTLNICDAIYKVESSKIVNV